MFKKKIACTQCKGSGLFLLKNPLVCENCNGKTCYKCEIYGTYKNIEECSNCYGSGNMEGLPALALHSSPPSSLK